MLRAYAHNLWVGGINFHPKHLGGHQNSIGHLYGGGALKTYVLMGFHYISNFDSP